MGGVLVHHKFQQVLAEIGKLRDYNVLGCNDWDSTFKQAKP